MPSPDTSNPFIMVYDALWDLAEASVALTDLVRVGNRIKLNRTGHSSKVKDEIAESDLPELVLVSTGSGGNFRDSSTSSTIKRNYEWVISTGQMNVTNSLLPVEWALFAAMIDFPAHLHVLRWPSDAEDGFVKTMRLASVEGGFADAERNRGIIGWSAIWGVEVEMHFGSADLMAVGVAGTGSGSGSGS